MEKMNTRPEIYFGGGHAIAVIVMESMMGFPMGFSEIGIRSKYQRI